MAVFRWMLLTTTTTMMMMMIVGDKVDAEEKPRKICRGTSSGLSHTGSTLNRLNNYKQRYENCTIVNGNLEIVFLATNDRVDLSFLKDIREVTGYVLIHSNTVTDLHLGNLRIIRGSTLTNCRLLPPNEGLNCSLLVAFNFHQKYQEWSLARLGLVSLQDILVGNVNIADNKQLCFSETTILWKDIFSSPNSRAFTDGNKECTKECHESCYHNDNKYCWGEGPEMCQKMTKVICSPQCDNRCSGQTPDSCCHKECAVGCTGPSTMDCLACGHFENDGKCEEHCPPVTTYDPQTLMQVNNPDGRFTYGSVCLKKCPAHLSTDNGACVKQCSPGHHIVNGNCVLCAGPCPKSCPGTGQMGITSSNIEELKGCKVINGNLLLLGTAFEGDAEHGIKPLTLDRLEILESIEEITGSLSVQLLNGGHIRSLSFLRNLRIIRGIELTEDLKSLKVISTDLESLSLHSLTEIGYGNVLISRNPKLCFVDSVDWNHLFRDADSTVVIKENNLTCGGRTCSSQCSELGCWGPEDTECLSCRNFKFKDKCLEACEMDPPIYAKDNSTCERCHPECTESCTGETASQCSSCLNVRNDQTCLPSCPPGKFPDEANTCLPCHENCGNHGCTGPLNIVGEGGCNSCDLVLFGDLSDRSKVTECINPKLSQCAEGFYKTGLHEFPENHTLHMKYGCRRCHPECVTCDDYGTNYCGQCRHYLQEDKCVPSCSTGFFPPSVIPLTLSMEKRADNKSHRPLSRQGKVSEAICQPCDPSCLTCHGPKSSDCHTCRNYLIFHDEAHPDKGFNCTTKCPESAPFKVTKEDNGTKITVCVVDDTSGHKAMVKVVVPVVVLLVVLVAVTILVVVVFNFKKAKRKSKMLTAAASLLVGDPLPIDPSGIAGDESRLGTISKKELRLGDKIGSGAFGSVYKGIWSPPSINCRIYVAIKVAHDCFGAQTNEVLDEVRVMSGVVHENCIRILGLCLAERIMIITQLMPYGCMLDFIKDNKENIGSKVLLNWAMQIAKGMEYLESKHIVHRDLAARNVLVQNDNHVRITDFGLSKILHGRDHYQSEGGKLPIKWLALESLQSKLFTHKSDVWSYGVTLWEMFTFGKKPYEHVEPCNMLDFLEKGDRLVQPSICTIDVYMVMIKCWIPHAADRPTFHQLVETFGVMARDPVRFLVITNDESKELKSTEPLALLRQLSTIDDEKPVMGIEEYLQRSDERRKEQEVSPGSTKEKVSPGTSTRVDVDEPSQAVQLELSHKKANGHALYHAKPRKTSLKESPSKSRYIDDPCDKADQRLLQRPTNFPPTIREHPSTTRDFDPNPGANDQDYLEPEKTPNGYLGPSSPQQSHPLFSAFSNPQYFELPYPDLINGDGMGTPLVGNGPSVKFANKKDGEAVASLVRQNSEPTNEVFEEEPGPASRLLGSIKDNNNEYYNDFLGPTRKPKNNSSTILGI